MIDYSSVLRFIDNMSRHDILNLTDEEINTIANLVEDKEGRSNFVKDHLYHMKKLYKIREQSSDNQREMEDKLKNFINEANALINKSRTLIK